MARKKTQRAITAAEVPCVLDDACTDRLAELLARLSAGARDEIEQHINWYRTGDGWRGHGPRIKNVPPEFDKMRKAAVALANRLRNVSIIRAIPSRLKRADDVRDHYKLVGIDCVVSIFSDAELIDAHGRLPDEQAIEDRLEGLLADLDWLASRVTAAQRHGKHRGRKTDRPQRFVKLVVSAIERDKGQWIKRSTNKNSPFELLKDIAAVVGIGPFTVEEVVRARQERLRRGEISRGKR
jgi:hypothetical protein